MQEITCVSFHGIGLHLEDNVYFKENNVHFTIHPDILCSPGQRLTEQRQVVLGLRTFEKQKFVAL